MSMMCAFLPAFAPPLPQQAFEEMLLFKKQVLYALDVRLGLLLEGFLCRLVASLGGLFNGSPHLLLRLA
jgi:hypothetical protein